MDIGVEVSEAQERVPERDGDLSKINMQLQNEITMCDWMYSG